MKKLSELIKEHERCEFRLGLDIKYPRCIKYGPCEIKEARGCPQCYDYCLINIIKKKVYGEPR